jgi:hypothetical protein
MLLDLLVYCSLFHVFRFRAFVYGCAVVNDTIPYCTPEVAENELFLAPSQNSSSHRHRAFPRTVTELRVSRAPFYFASNDKEEGKATVVRCLLLGNTIVETTG